MNGEGSEPSNTDVASRIMDRRQFFGRVALAGGGIVVTAALPWPAASALARPAAGAAVGGAALGTALADWSIDDQWAPAPRYADPIGYGARTDGLTAASDASAPSSAALGSIDALFYV
jgi:hypothetical protein